MSKAESEKTLAYLRFGANLLGYKKRITVANVFLNILIFSYQAAITLCVREILNGLEGGAGRALAAAKPYLIGIGIATVVRILAIYGCAVLDGKRSYYYQNRLRANILKTLLGRQNALSVSGQSGALFEIIDDDVPAATYPAELLTEVSGYCFYTLIAVSILLRVNWRLTLFLFLPLSAAIWGVKRLSGRMMERRKTSREAHDAASAFIGDVAASALAIRAAGAADAVLRQYERVNAGRREAVVRDAVFCERVSALLNGAVCVGSAVMMLIAARLMAGGSFGIGDFSIFIAHLGTLSDCANRIVELFCETKRAQVSYERIRDAVGAESASVLSERADIALYKSAKARKAPLPEEAFRSFEARGLRYTYSGTGGFRGVSFAVRPGELVAVCGEMASGKSTLLAVLMGLLPPDEGEMLWNGEPIRGLSDRRSGRIAGAPQKGGFFSASVEENLCLGAEPGEESVREALAIASLADGQEPLREILAKDAGSGGDRLSGGQRQRLAIARTILRGAKLMILDDCVSALDDATQIRVLRALRAHLAKTGRALIIATNAKPFLESADSVIRLTAGSAGDCLADA